MATAASPTPSETVTPPTAAPAPARSAAFWLLPTGLFALAAIGILWALPRPTTACIAIYPTPPECAAGDTSVVIPFLVLIVVLYAAIVACAILATRSRAVVLGILTGALGLLFLIGLLTVLTAANPDPVIYY